jgi:sulfate adenylyltransferase subunit 2
VVERQGLLIMRDDARLPLEDGETANQSLIRFRTLGCYPLTAATPSSATNTSEVIEELRSTPLSERHGRLIDHDPRNSMEAKKRAGYF